MNRFARRLMPLVVGLVVGAALVTAISWKRPARDRFEQARWLLLEQSRYPNEEWLGYGPRGLTVEREWAGVRSPTSPTFKVRRGLDVTRFVTGLTYPVNIAFKLDPPASDQDPFFYVNELHGAIKYVTRAGEVHLYADGLTNIEPTRRQARTDEAGLTGLHAIAGTEDLLIAGSFLDEASGLLKNRILRLRSAPGGRSAAAVETVLVLDEFTSPSHQIQQLMVGPDGKLWVAVGDGEDHRSSLSLDRFGGKILRLELDGSACRDNPFYDASAPGAVRGYVWAYGLRNVFDFDFQPETDRPYGVDNGETIDRLVRLVAGASYGWDGRRDSTRVNALFTWGPRRTAAPVGFCFLRRPALGAATAGRLYVALYGPPAAVGRNHGKSIIEFELGERGLVTRVGAEVVQYVGGERATILGLAEGPDGLYFTDFFGDTRAIFAQGAGSVWRLHPSTATRDLPDLDTLRRGDSPGQTLFRQHCNGCHRLDGVGGVEGPELTDAAAALERRLSSPAWEATAHELLQAPGAFQVEQRPRLEEVLSARGSARVDAWLPHHLEEPRFDHPWARMPSFVALSPDDRRAIMEFVLRRE